MIVRPFRFCLAQVHESASFGIRHVQECTSTWYSCLSTCHFSATLHFAVVSCELQKTSYLLSSGAVRLLHGPLRVCGCQLHGSQRPQACLRVRHHGLPGLCLKGMQTRMLLTVPVGIEGPSVAIPSTLCISGCFCWCQRSWSHSEQKEMRGKIA